MKKIKKTKTGLTVTLGFAAVALLSVGFSAWVVNLDSSDDTGNVSVQVADTTTNSVNITAEIIEDDNSFRFDAPKDDDTGPITFSGDPETDGEDLSFSFWVKLEKTGINSDIYFNLLEDTSNEDDYKYDLLKAMVEDADTKTDGIQQYIEAPFNFDYTKTLLIGSDLSTDDAAYDTYYDAPETFPKKFPKVNVDWNDELERYDVTMYFRWGSYTGNTNPSLYDEINLTNATTVLNYLNNETNKAELREESICLTISHTYQ